MDKKIEKALTAAPVDADRLLYDVVVSQMLRDFEAVIKLMSQVEASGAKTRRVKNTVPAPATIAKLVSYFVCETNPARTRRWVSIVVVSFCPHQN
jgi:hypothetical protein